MPTDTFPITATANDGYRASPASFGTGYCYAGKHNGTIYDSFFRFTSVTIPRGAVIHSAKLLFVCETSYSNVVVNTRIQAEHADNPNAVTSYADYTNRVKTTAFVDWDAIPAWTAGQPYESPDIASVISDVIEEAWWDWGDALQIFWFDHGSTVGSLRLRRPAGYESARTEPRLEITWEPPSGSADLSAQFEVGQGSADLSAQFTVAQWQEDLPARFEVGQSSQELFGKTDVRHPDSTDLLGWFVITYEVSESVDAGLAESLVFGDALFQSEDLQDQLAESITFFPIKGSADLLGKGAIRHEGTPVELLSRFIVRPIITGSAELLGRGIVRHDGTPVELPGKVKIQHTGIPVELLSRFTIRHTGTPVELLGKANIRHSGSVGLLGEADVRQLTTADLLGRAKIRHIGIPVKFLGKAIIRHMGMAAEFRANAEIKNIGSAELLGRGIVRHDGVPVELLGRTVVRHVGTPVELLGKAVIRHVGTPVELFGKTIIRQAGTPVELLGKGIVKNIGSVGLLGEADVRQLTTADLLGRAEIRHTGAPLELLSGFTARHSDYVDLLSRFEVGQDSADLLSRFEVGQDSADLLARVEVGQDSADLSARSVTRHSTSLDLKLCLYVRPEESSALEMLLGGRDRLLDLGGIDREMEIGGRQRRMKMK